MKTLEIITCTSPTVVLTASLVDYNNVITPPTYTLVVRHECECASEYIEVSVSAPCDSQQLRETVRYIDKVFYVAEHSINADDLLKLQCFLDAECIDAL